MAHGKSLGCSFGAAEHAQGVGVVNPLDVPPKGLVRLFKAPKGNYKYMLDNCQAMAVRN